MGERGSEAAGGGLPLEERRDRSAGPACADASHAGAGSGPASPGKNINQASPTTSRTTAGRAKDRRGGGDVHGSTGLRHGET